MTNVFEPEFDATQDELRSRGAALDKVVAGAPEVHYLDGERRKP